MELTEFPNEILSKVISYIALNSDLYRNIHFHAEALEDSPEGGPPILKRTNKLIANLRERPELRAYTTALSLRVTNPVWYRSYPQLDFLSRMPRLRKLSYDPPGIHGREVLTENKELTALRLDFSHVTNHYDSFFSTAWLEIGVPLQITACNLWHSSLRKIQAEKVFFTDKFETGPWLGKRRMQLGRSSIEDLRFLDCCQSVKGDSLTEFIHSVSHLKCFVLEIDLRGGPRGTLDPLALGIDIGPALLAHRETIQELAISLLEWCTRDVCFMQHLPSLVQWSALKRLAIPEILLEDALSDTKLHQVLPRQLEELQLGMKYWDADVKGPKFTQLLTERWLILRDLATTKQEHIPRLKRVIWWLQRPPPKTFGGLSKSIRLHTLDSMFKAVDVSFEWVVTAFFKETPVGKRLYEWQQVDAKGLDNLPAFRYA